MAADSEKDTNIEQSTTEQRDDSVKADAQREDFSREKAIEFVENLRKERQAEAKDTASADAKKPETETDQKSAAAKGDDAQADSKDDEKDEESPVFTAEDMAKPGFFDRLSKDEWKALEKQHPVVVQTYKAAQAELTRRGQKLAEKEAALKEREQKLASTTVPATTDETDKELEALGFTAEDVKKLLTSRVGREIIAEAVQQSLQSSGIDPDKTDAQVEGFDLALSKIPELRDNEVWAEVKEAIESDPDELARLDASKDPREIARILRAAAGPIIAARAAKTQTKSEKESKKAEKETKNATQVVSKAVNAPRRSTSALPVEKLPLKEQMREHVKDLIASKGYKEIR